MSRAETQPVYTELHDRLADPAVGGVPDLVVEGETGYLVKPGDMKGLAEAIIELLRNPEKAKEMGISGATVFRGIMGYGTSSKIHSSRFWELTEKLPVIIELVDQTDILEAFYKDIEKELFDMPKGCLVTLEATEILLQKKGK